MKKQLSGILCALFVGSLAVTLAPTTASANETTCEIQDITEVLGTNPRIAVFCRNAQSVSGVRYIAIPSSASYAARFLSQAQAAMLSGKNFFADIPVSSATNVPGCLASDCRTPTWFGIWH